MSHPDLSPTPAGSPEVDSDVLLEDVHIGLRQAKDVLDPASEFVQLAGGPQAIRDFAASVVPLLRFAPRTIVPIAGAIAAGIPPATIIVGGAVVVTGALLYLNSRSQRKPTGPERVPAPVPEIPAHLLSPRPQDPTTSTGGNTPLKPRLPWLLIEEEFNDRGNIGKHMLDFMINPSYPPERGELKILDDPRFGGTGILTGHLRDLVSASGRVTAHTWLLGDALETGVVPALAGAVDSLTPADIAFGDMALGLDDLKWVTDATLEGLTVNAAAMSAGLTPWVAGISKEIERRRSELEAYRPLPRPVPRRDSPPGSGSSGGGLSWDEGLDLYQKKSRETAENIAWIRTHPDDRAESGENVDWTFRDIVRDAVRRSGEVPLFAMGGVVPGMVGTPVPAVVHGGEEIVGRGNGGGVPINLEVHVHGTVISEGDLAKNVRDGLMRRFD